MSSEFYYSITGSLSSGIDFYGLAIELTSLSIECSSDASATASKIAYASVSIECQGYNANLGSVVRYASCNVDIASDTTTNAFKIAFSSASSSIESNLEVSAYEIQLLSSFIDITSNLQILVNKTTFSTIAISCDSSLQATSIKQSKATSAVSGDLSVSVSAGKLLFATSAINAFTVVTALAGEDSFAKADITTGVSLIATAIKFAVNDVPDTAQYRTLFVIDNKPLTNQGRTLTSDQSMVFIENKNWNNLKSRYYKRSSSAGRNSFNLSWTFLPNSRYDTVDKRYARDFIRELASDPDVHVLKVINNDSDDATPYTETSYNVFIRDYSETLVRRDLQNDVYYWDCNLTLEEV